MSVDNDDCRQRMIDFDAVTVSLRVDKDPTHYYEGIPVDDPRRMENEICEVCGLLPEYQTECTCKVLQIAPNGALTDASVCCAACKCRYSELYDIIQSIYS